jgi:hypothetical protein
MSFALGLDPMTENISGKSKTGALINQAQTFTKKKTVIRVVK